ncbi:hypothetical protein NA57DRAFT_58960 [Rhizodiscina lignyota]|uniref:CENP-V/GFA domain-containing protein n=1 Tax=Rhizodiscina lignyota TaxID=1504668 RepID=A0A9P4M3M9_9PEZI|nr:hypothetical protein NA57DRAFT_58960 [Rhizodiscina lignyota]
MARAHTRALRSHTAASCRWCQKQTGASFALHAFIEKNKLKILAGEVEEVTVESPSGAGQVMTRCSKCHFAVWSVYLSLGPEAEVVRSLDVGTLDEPDACPPDYHIYTHHKQRWITFSDDIPVFDQLYDENEIWPKDKLLRRRKALEKKTQKMRLEPIHEGDYVAG